MAMKMMHKYDIIQEILLRLPIKSLVRCTCLSQKWHEFISYNQYFRGSYISRDGRRRDLMMGFFLDKSDSYGGEEPVRFLPTSSDGKLLKKRKRHHDDVMDKGTCSTDDDDVYPVDTSLSFLGHDIVHVMGSSNGFLLVTLERDSPMTYMICNPLNKQQIVLPKPNLTPRYVVHGFTCNAALTHYKVVRALCFKALDYTTTLTLEIFSSDFPQWRQFNGTCPIPYFLNLTLRHSGVINECLTYLPASRDKANSGPEKILLVYDQSKEILQVMEVPQSEDIYSCHFFGTSDGHIVFGRSEFHQLKMWLLKDKSNGESKWSLKHKVNLKRVENYFECAKDGFEGQIEYLIAFHPTDLQVFFLGCGNKNYQYHVENSRFELICDFDQQDYSDRGYWIFPYTYPLIGPHLFRDH